MKIELSWNVIPRHWVVVPCSSVMIWNPLFSVSGERRCVWWYVQEAKTSWGLRWGSCMLYSIWSSHPTVVCITCRQFFFFTHNTFVFQDKDSLSSELSASTDDLSENTKPKVSVSWPSDLGPPILRFISYENSPWLCPGLHNSLVIFMFIVCRFRRKGGCLVVCSRSQNPGMAPMR